MKSKDYGHGPMPPSMFVDRAIEAPGSDQPRWPTLRSFGRTLTFDELLQINPFTLRLGQIGRPCLRSEVAYDDTESL